MLTAGMNERSGEAAMSFSLRERVAENAKPGEQKHWRVRLFKYSAACGVNCLLLIVG